MTGISIQCPNCNKSHTLAEDSALAGVRCGHCGCPVSAPPETPVPTMLEQRLEAPAPVAHLTLATAGAALASTAVAAPVVRKPSTPEYAPAVTTWMGWVLLAAISAGMIGFQLFAAELGEYLPFYIAARNTLFVLVGLLVIYEAWQDGLSQGILCLLIPPYLLLYAIAQLESSIVRSLFFALILSLGMEAWLLPQHSMVMSIGPLLNNLIDFVNGVIASNKL